MHELNLDPRYEALTCVGKGAFGEVYKAHDRTLGKAVAIKVLTELGEEHLARFQREAALLATHPHPGLVAVLDLDLEVRPPYVVLEWMPGGDLAGLLETVGTCTPEETCRIGAELAEALAHLHQHEVLHRDLKLENVLLREDCAVALADLGLARPGEGRGHPDLTRTGKVVGTPRYLPLEVLTHGHYSPQADLYALGAILVELATGTRLEGLASMTHQGLALTAEVRPPPLRELLADCLATDPHQRPQDADHLARRLRKLQRSLAPTSGSTTQVLARPPSSPRPPPERRRRGPTTGALVALGAVVALGLVAAASRTSVPPAPAPPTAAAAAEAAPPPEVDLRTRLRDLDQQLVRHQTQLEACSVESPGMDDILKHPLMTHLERIQRALEPACLEAYGQVLDTLGVWIPVAERALDELGELPDPAGVLWNDAPNYRTFNHVVEVTRIEERLQRLAVTFPQAIATLAERRRWVVERRSEMQQRAFAVADQVAGDPREASLVKLLARVHLLDPAVGQRAQPEVAHALAARLRGDQVPLVLRERVVATLRHLLGKFRHRSVLREPPLECDESARLFLETVGWLVGPETSELSRAYGMLFAATYGVTQVMRCGEAGGLEVTWVRDRLVEYLAYTYAIGSHRWLHDLEDIFERTIQTDGDPEVLAADRARAKAARGWMPQDPSIQYARWPGHHLTPAKLRGQLEEVRASSQQLQAAIDRLAPCAQVTEAHQATDVDAIDRVLDTMLSPDCQDASRDLHPPLRTWLAQVEALEVAGFEAEEQAQVLGPLLRGPPAQLLGTLEHLLNVLERNALQQLAYVGRSTRVARRISEAQEAELELWSTTLPAVHLDPAKPRGGSAASLLLSLMARRRIVHPGAPAQAFARKLLEALVLTASDEVRLHVTAALVDFVRRDQPLGDALPCEARRLVLDTIGAAWRHTGRTEAARKLGLGLYQQATETFPEACRATAP